MIRTLRRVDAAVCVAVITLILVGCGGEDNSTSGLGPISQKMRGLDNSFASSLDAIYAETDALIASCMKDKGFDYVPEEQGVSTTVAEVNGIERGTKRFAETYGYGITTADEIAEATGQSAAEEPSQLDELSETEIDAYYSALYGDAWLGTAEEGNDSGGATTGSQGCMAEALDVTDEILRDLDTAVLDDVIGLSSQAVSSAEVAETFPKWSACMADEGYDYETPEDAIYSILDQDAALDKESKTLRNVEIATATSDFTCSESSGLRSAQAQSLERLEEEYYAEHRDEVDALFEQLEKIIDR